MLAVSYDPSVGSSMHEVLTSSRTNANLTGEDEKVGHEEGEKLLDAVLNVDADADTN